MKTLILGRVPDDFDPEKHHPLGPWCFVGREDVYPNWQALDFELDPFATSDELAEAARVTGVYANSLIPILTEQLNSENGTYYSKKFWRLLLMPWLLCLVQTTWERQCRLKRFLQKYQDNAFKVELVKHSPDWRFDDTSSFVSRGVLNPDYNEWLYSRMLERNMPPSWQMSYVEKSIRFNSLSPDNTWKTWIRDSVFSRLRCSGVYGIGPIMSIVLSLFLSLKPLRRSVIFDHAIAEETNAKLSWMLDIENLIQSTLPTCFRDIKKLGANLKKTRTKAGMVDLIGPGIYYKESEKMRLAYRIETGERIVSTQHGGNYGTLKSVPLISQIEYGQAAFISWGWGEQEDYSANVAALPSPYLGRMVGKRRRVNDELVLVGTLANLLSYRLDSTPQALQQLEYRRNKSDFIKGLKPLLLEKTSYRPYFSEDGALSDRSYFKRTFPTIKIVDGDLYTRIMRCKLLVLDHPITTLNVALAANIPMVGFWDKRAWAMSRQAIPYFASLEKASVFFETGEAAAKHVNEIWDDVQGWWNQSKIQQARNAWCCQYARTSSLWWWEWMKILWRI